MKDKVINFENLIYKYFNKSKYTKWYLSIISQKYNHKGYVEKHHIIPVSIAPEFTKCTWNIVPLTARQHYICHLLLVKMCLSGYHRRKMINALFFLMNKHKEKINISSRLYEIAVINRSISLSGENNPFYDKLHNKETIKNIRNSLIGFKHTEDSKNKISIASKNHGKKISASVRCYYLFNDQKIIIEEFQSISEAAKKTNIKTGKISACCLGTRKNTGCFNLSTKKYIGLIGNQGLPDNCVRLQWQHIEKKEYKARKVICLETKEIFDSSYIASKILRLNKSAVKNAIQRGNKAGGFTWAYYENQ